jgi:hypothetical protein
MDLFFLSSQKLETLLKGGAAFLPYLCGAGMLPAAKVMKAPPSYARVF